jgi:hypothetical protein
VFVDYFEVIEKIYLIALKRLSVLIGVPTLVLNIVHDEKFFTVQSADTRSSEMDTLKNGNVMFLHSQTIVGPIVECRTDKKWNSG